MEFCSCRSGQASLHVHNNKGLPAPFVRARMQSSSGQSIVPLNFDLVFQVVGNRWRLYGISIATPEAAPAQPQADQLERRLGFDRMRDQLQQYGDRRRDRHRPLCPHNRPVLLELMRSRRGLTS
jgi:hypothetical protein